MEYATIFDMDGVLIDSYRPHYQSWRITAAEHGRDVTEAEFAATFGKTSREVIAAWWPHQPKTEEQIRAIDERKEQIFRDLLREHFPLMPGVEKLVRDLHRNGIKLAIGSSGPPENVQFVVERLPFRDLFEAIVHGRDVERGKPDPGIFLLAAQRLGVDPANCAVVEDSPVGIEAAHRAGMIAIGLASTGRQRRELAAAELVVDSHDELSPDRIVGLIRAKRRTQPKA
ncbi:MAG: HAD family phosphatase [Planctomycetota bacterium]|nr:MAG: HAD family phosphatase [Planctomycetota bacterium]